MKRLIYLPLAMLLTMLAASCNKPEPEPEPSGPEVERIELKLPFVADTTSVEIEGINGYTFGTVPEWLEIKQNEEGIELITKRKGEEDIEQASAKVMLTSEKKTIELDITKGGYPTFEADIDFDNVNETAEIQLSNVQNTYDIIVISLNDLEFLHFFSWPNRAKLYDTIMEYVQESDRLNLKHYSDFQDNKIEIYFDPRKTPVLVIFAVDENHYVGEIDTTQFSG